MLVPGIKKDVLLKNYTTFKIGGQAKYFFEAKNKEDLIKAVVAAKKNKLPFFILGNGSNVLAEDDGFNGLIIKTKSSKLKTKNHNSKTEPRRVGARVKMKTKFSSPLKTIYAETGTPLSMLVSKAIKNGLMGVEWAVGVPGSAGGAICGNAGAFGKAMGDIVKSVEVLEITRAKLKTFKNQDCKFGYRDSIFKKNKNLIILSAELQLKKGNKKEIKEKIKEYLEYRKKNQPLNFSSAGSVFQNSPGFSAGELIEKCGLKGKRIGNAKISEKHANFIVNLGGAKSVDVKKLIALAKKEVKNKFKIDLEEEIQYL